MALLVLRLTLLRALVQPEQRHPERMARFAGLAFRKVGQGGDAGPGFAGKPDAPMGGHEV